MTTAWDRSAAVHLVRNRLWKYVSAHASTADLPGVLEDLWQLPRDQVRRLAATHLALASETTEMLEAATVVLRQLPSSIRTAEVELVGTVRGPIVWDRTFRRRWATADPSRFVCRPAERRYDTALGRLVLLALTQCMNLVAVASLAPSGSTGRQLAFVREHAGRLRLHRKLQEVRAVPAISERVLAALETRPHVQPLVRFVHAVREGVVELQPAMVEAVLGQYMLAPASNDRLFELMVGFILVDTLETVGYVVSSPQLVTGSAVPLATLERGNGRLTLWWQRSVWTLALSAGSVSRFHRVLDGAGVSKSDLRPDLILVSDSPRRILIIEVKHTERDGFSPERRGIAEALAYLDDASSILATFPTPHALVVGWNAEGRPSKNRVVVSDQDHLMTAVKVIVDNWRDDDAA